LGSKHIRLAGTRDTISVQADWHTPRISTSSPDWPIGMDIAFVRNQDGLLLTLDSPKWKLERGKAYTVRLSAAGRSAEAKALAESKGVTIAFADRSFNERLRAANVLEVKAEGATLQVPLDRSAMALDRLESCFEKNGRESAETNPFVAPSRKP
jgi:hypothetical protein